MGRRERRPVIVRRILFPRGRTRCVGLQPTDLIRGHPRLLRMLRRMRRSRRWPGRARPWGGELRSHRCARLARAREKEIRSNGLKFLDSRSEKQGTAGRLGRIGKFRHPPGCESAPGAGTDICSSFVRIKGRRRTSRRPERGARRNPPFLQGAAAGYASLTRPTLAFWKCAATVAAKPRQYDFGKPRTRSAM